MKKKNRRRAEKPQNNFHKTSLLFNKDELRNIEPVIKKSLAVSSGKGGVGKTITAINLSIYYAKKGFRVGLLDLDPLSDITTILDIYEAELHMKGLGLDKDQTNFTDYVINIFDNLDLIFPASKLNKNDCIKLFQKIYRDFATELDRSYDILIFDMPAGSSYENNLTFLPFMNALILVTNPEPTAHVSAGGYIKKVLSLYPNMTINIWHNRYSGNSKSGFNPKDVAGNYNKNVDDEIKLSTENIAQIRDFAFIPEDPSLNLLRGSPRIILNIQRCILDTSEFIQEEILDEISSKLDISDNVFDLVKFFIRSKKHIDSIDDYLDDLGEYLNTLLTTNTVIAGKGIIKPDQNLAGIDVFTPAERLAFYSFLQTVKEDKLRESVVKLIQMLEEKIEKLEDSERIFSVQSNIVPDKIIDREIACLLIELNRASISKKAYRNYGGLLLFYFSLYKLLQSKTIVTLISNLIPQKRNSKGLMIRDRYQQIKNLVARDKEYRQKYFSLIKTLYPVATKQVATIIRTFELSNLVFKNKKNEIIRKAYLKLLNNFIHDTIYSGLSVIVGFEYRAAAIAFQEGAERILKSMSV